MKIISSISILLVSAVQCLPSNKFYRLIGEHVGEMNLNGIIPNGEYDFFNMHFKTDLFNNIDDVTQREANAYQKTVENVLSELTVPKVHVPSEVPAIKRVPSKLVSIHYNQNKPPTEATGQTKSIRNFRRRLFRQFHRKNNT